jgi:hypothetical protein
MGKPMNDPLKTYTGQRAETLAREFLTRSPEVEFHHFEPGEVDYILTLRPHPKGKPQGFMAFGAMVKGTDRDIADERNASRYLMSHIFDKKKSRPTAYFIPMLAILYAVKSNAGYFAWLSKPELVNGRPMLQALDELDCRRIDQESLEEVISTVRSWYDQLAGMMLVSA